MTQTHGARYILGVGTHPPELLAHGMDLDASTSLISPPLLETEPILMLATPFVSLATDTCSLLSRIFNVLICLEQ